MTDRPRILLVLSTTRESEKSVDVAIARAKESGGELLVLLVLDEDLPRNIVDHLTERGFIGNTPSSQLYDAILKEYEIQGKTRFEAVKRRAEAASVPCRAIMTRGSFAQQTLAVIRREGVTTAVITKRKRSNLSRFLLGSVVKDLREKSPCEVLIVGE